MPTWSTASLYCGDAGGAITPPPGKQKELDHKTKDAAIDRKTEAKRQNLHPGSSPATSSCQPDATPILSLKGVRIACLLPVILSILTDSLSHPEKPQPEPGLPDNTAQTWMVKRLGSGRELPPLNPSSASYDVTSDKLLELCVSIPLPIRGNTDSTYMVVL